LNEELKNKIRNVKDTFKQIELAQQARKLAEAKMSAVLKLSNIK
jgi:hypothetical protein